MCTSARARTCAGECRMCARKRGSLQEVRVWVPGRCGALDRDGATEDASPARLPILGGGAVNLVDGARVPHDQIARLRPELEQLGVLEQVVL
jgi:hypothetical protein